MVQPIKFSRLETSFKGLMNRAVRHFNRYVGKESASYRWVFIENPEPMARALEVLADDLPEDDLAEVIPRLPYLVLLFRSAKSEPVIPVEGVLAFLSIVNRTGMVTVLRQASDRQKLGTMFQLNPGQWVPMLFLCGGVADLDVEFEGEVSEQSSFF